VLPQTLHPYVYVNNNPVNLTDPSGEIAPIIIAIALGMLIGGGAGGIIFAITHPCTDLLRSSDFWQSILVGAISGGVAGLVSWLVPLLLPTASGFWSATGVGMITGSAAGGAGQATANLLNGKPLHQDMLQAMLLGGALGGLAGGVSWKIRELLKPKPIGWTGQIGENELRKLGGQSQVFFRTSQGGRYVDQLVNGIAHESKVGYQTLTQSIQRQIAKDVELMATGQIKAAVWHFFTSPVTGQGGASAGLTQALQKAGIQIVIH
jgi:hypothetical protein